MLNLISEEESGCNSTLKGFVLHIYFPNILLPLGNSKAKITSIIEEKHVKEQQNFMDRTLFSKEDLNTS